MEVTPTVENAVAWFDAHTVTRRRGLDRAGLQRRWVRFAFRRETGRYASRGRWPAYVTVTRPYSESEADFLFEAQHEGKGRE